MRTVTEVALDILEKMQNFYKDFPEDIQEVLDFEKEKFMDADKRYAWIIRKKFGNGFVKKEMELVHRSQNNTTNT